MSHNRPYIKEKPREFSLQQAANWMQATLFGIQKGQDLLFTGLSTDSRALRAGHLFVAIKGERVDGHQFLAEVQAKGAVAAIVEKAQTDISLPQLIVDNPVLALGRFAQSYRQGFSLPLAAVTGSCGKTTVKEMIASILSMGSEGSEAYLASQGNLNTEVGLPLTLLRLKPEHRLAVIEMGARQKGDIRYLMSLAQPDVTLITNAGVAHLEVFGSERGIAEAKGEIFAHLKQNGTAVINGDDPNAEYWQSLLKGQKLIRFGLGSKEFDFTCKDFQETFEGCQFELLTPKGNRKIVLKAFGQHSVSNALAAAATAFALGCSLDEIVLGLEKFQPVSGRLQLKPGIEGSKIMDDTYNANPVSVKAALAVLAGAGSKSAGHSDQANKIFVMGDMLELGPNAAAQHREIGEEARRLGIDKMYGFGPLTNGAIEAFGTGGKHYSDKATLIQELINQEKAQFANTRILVKGSRGMRMEEVVQALVLADTMIESDREKNPC